MSEYNLRTAMVAVSESDDKTYGRKVTIAINGSLPNIILTKDGKYSTVDKIDEKETIVYPADTAKNILLDKNDPDRYKFIGNVKSVMSDMELCIYYDNKYKDIFIIGSLLSMGIDDDIELYANTGIRVTGYRLFGMGLDKYSNELTLPVERTEDEKFKLFVVPNRLNTIKSFIAINDTGINNLGIELIGNDVNNKQLYDKSRLPTGYIDLGEVTDLFDTDISIPTFNTLCVGVGQSMLHYLGMIKSRRLVIPINF